MVFSQFASMLSLYYNRSMAVSAPFPAVAVLIPVLNEEEAIGRVLDDIPARMVSRVVVIDNGSEDGTVDIARDRGCTVLHESRRGYGYALMKGIQHLRADPPEIAVFMDGDYSDHPDELPALVRPIIDDGFDMVIGSRVLGRAQKGALLFQARLGNWLATRLIGLMWGVRFTDLGPFRAIRFHRLLELEMREMTYGWTVEMQIKAARRGLKTREVPVSYRRRIGKSKVTGTISGTFRAGVGIMRTILMAIFRR